MNHQSQTVIDLLKSHRSVRSFTPEAVSEDTVSALVIAGTRASTSSNMQAYTVITITDGDQKKRLATLCGDQKQIYESAAFLVFCADLHKLTLACRMHQVETAAPGEAEALLVAVVDTALVMQNVAVAAESLGYGICMIGAMRTHPSEVGETLGLPEHVMALSGMCIGRPAEAGEVKPRLPLDATLHVNRYRPDDTLESLLRDYDELQSQWYQDRGMHVRDPRWTAVMSRRLPGVEKRRSVGLFLRNQGFLRD